MQADTTIKSMENLNDIPYDIISIQTIKEKSIAHIMYEYELLTSICAKFLYINANDQPGIVKDKIILKQKTNAVTEITFHILLLINGAYNGFK